MKKIFIITALLLLQVDILYSGIIQENALSFIGGAAIPEGARKILFDSIRKNPDNSNFIVESEGFIYSLKILQIPRLKSNNKFAQNALSSNYAKIAELQAVNELAKYLDKGRLDRKIFTNSDAADYALRVFYSQKIKIQSQTSIIDHSALSLVFTGKNNVPDSISKQEITNNYCKYLYEQAQNFFRKKDFVNALETLHQIHYMSWADISAYLGASYCFLQMSQKEDAAKLTLELINSMSQDMKADDFASAGRILFQSGRKDEGFNAMEQAYKLLREN
ncbi:MAG: hypothetical protein IJS99_00970 [Synergistaceae bacterium]|nr:hypothetical protein [Synergistaceae bacterium]